MAGRNGREATINLRQLSYFRKLVETGNMTSAAQALNVAQPALSTQIRHLEEELGVELIQRHSRGVTPTKAGELLHKHAETILANVEQATAELQAFNASRQNHLRLGTCPSMVMMLGPDLLIDMHQTMPDLTISLMEERSVDLLSALDRGQVDVALLYEVEASPDLVREAVIEEDLLLVSAPSSRPRDVTVSFAEALRSELALGGERSVLRQIIEAEARRLSLELRLGYEIHSLSSMKALVARGAASTIMPYSLAAEELDNGMLAGWRIDRPALTRTLYMVRNRRPVPILGDPRVRAHLDTLVGTYLSKVGSWARRLG